MGCLLYARQVLLPRDTDTLPIIEALPVLEDEIQRTEINM